MKSTLLFNLCTHARVAENINRGRLNIVFKLHYVRLKKKHFDWQPLLYKTQ